MSQENVEIVREAMAIAGHPRACCGSVAAER